MKLTGLLSVFVGVCFSCACANPIAVDAERRPAAMISEDVTLEVGAEYSVVTGDFAFRQGKDDWPVQKDTHVLVYVPVFLPAKGYEKFVAKHGRPVVTVKGIAFDPTANVDLAQVDRPKAPALPKGWSMEVYEYKIPLRLIGREFRLSVRYIQPHFPGRVAAYMPIMPPEDHTRAKISFVPQSGYALREPGLLAAFAPREARMEFTPRHREFLKAQLVKK